MFTRLLKIPLVGFRLRNGRSFSTAVIVKQSFPSFNGKPGKKNMIYFPFLKDKTELIKRLHKNTNLPFNVMRDVLEFPLAAPDEVDNVSEVWVRYVGTGDEDDIVSQLKRIENPTKFWLITIRIALSDSLFMDRLLTLIKSEKLVPIIEQLSFPLAETLVASLMNSQRFDSAYYIFRDLLKHSNNINWDPIFNVCLLSEEPHSLRTLMLIHGEVENKLYDKIIPHLFKLELKAHYIHKWNNVLIMYNDFPKDSSAHLNPVLESILSTSNLRSLKNCIPRLGKFARNSDNWLDKKTIKLLSEYIILSTDQEAKLSSILDTFGVQSFSLEEFWVNLFYKTSIRTKTLQTFIKQVGIEKSDSIKISEAISHRLLKEDPDKFLTTFNEQLNEEVPVSFDKSLQILKLHIQASENREIAYEFVVDMLEKFPAQAGITASIYLIQSMKIYREGDLEFLETFIKFENYIREHQLSRQNKISGALIYANLKLLRLRRAVEDIKSLINSNQKIEPRTIHHSYEILKKNHRSIPHDLIDRDVRNTNEFVLKLIMKMSKRCPEISAVTFNIILRDVVWTFGLQDSELILCEITDFLRSRQKTNISSNNTAHILKKVFDKELTSDILKKGFRNPKEPWSGLTVIKTLQGKGVHFELSKVKSECLTYLDSLNLANTDKAQSKIPWIKPSIALPAVDQGLFFSKINEMMEVSRGSDQHIH